MTEAGAIAANPLGDLAARIEATGDGFRLSGADGWMQGRTMYGGASSFLAYCAARLRFPDLPPLRGAQIGFVAPVGSEVEIAVTMLRAGRSVSQVQTDLFCDGGLAHRGLWLFGSARPSNGEVAPALAEDFVPFEGAETIRPPEGMHFVHNLEIRRAEPHGGLRAASVRRWVRLRDRTGLDPVGELIGIGDALPPGSLRAMERHGPISSINWSLTLLGDAPQTRDGWWLLETSSNHLADGFSSETLRMWNADGVEVMRGLQSVAVFG